MLRRVFFSGLSLSLAFSWLGPVHGQEATGLTSPERASLQRVDQAVIGRGSSPAFAAGTVDGTLFDHNTGEPGATDLDAASLQHARLGTTYSYWVPVASHASGDEGSQWRTDLGILNTGTATADVELRHIVGATVKTNTTYVPAGTQTILTDVVAQIESSGTGPIELLSNQPVVVTSRTYNKVGADQACYANGSQGQSYATLASGDGLSAEQGAVLPQLSENDAYRSNIMLINVSSAVATATVSLHDGSGREVGHYEVTLQPGERVQHDKPFRTIAQQTDVARGYARVHVNTGSGVVAFASVADNITNDPTTITMCAPPPAAQPKVTEFAAGISPSAGPQGITAGPDGALWFAEWKGGRIGRITTDGVVTEYSAGISPSPSIECIANGPDGNVWFTETNRNRVGRVTMSGQVTEFSAGITNGGAPIGIAAGPDGALWFTESGKSRIGRITTSGTVTEYSKGMSLAAFPNLITAGPDGALWFTEWVGNRIGRITTDGVITEFSTGITPEAGLVGITTGPDGNLWFTEFNANRVGRITPAGVVTEFSEGISSGASPIEITAGPDGALWFTEFGRSRIGRITTDGVVTEFSDGISSNSGPGGITTGPDGAIWFTENRGNRIARYSGPGVGSADSSTSWVPVASHAGGDKGSQWRTDLGILNTGTARANVELRHIVGATVKSSTLEVAGVSQEILTDVVEQISSSGTGPIEVRSDQPVVVTSRTYNKVAADQACYANGSQGQSYPTLASGDGLSAGQSAVLPQLTEDAAYRTNIMLINVSTAPATATVTLFDGAGKEVASYDVTLQPGERRQHDKPFRILGQQSNMARGYARVHVTAGSGVVAFASVADNTTNDPTTITMVR